MYESSLIRRLLFVALSSILVGLPISKSLADHGGSSHLNVDLAVPATSTDGSYTVTWTPTGYPMYLQQKVGGGSYTIVYYGHAGSRSFSGVPAGTYTYRIYWRFCYYGCFDMYSEPVSIAVTNDPNTPSPLTGPNGDDDGSFVLNWTNIPTATHYKLERRVGTGAWADILPNPTTTSYSESGLADGEYEYRVSSCDASGCSTPTATKAVDVAYTPGPMAPINGPDDVHVSVGNYTISWNAATGNVSTYELQEGVNYTSAFVTVQNTAALNRSYISKAAGSYFYRVRACNKVGSFTSCGNWSDNKLVDVQTFVDMNLSSPASSSTGSYTVSWTPQADSTETLQESANNGDWQNKYTGLTGSYSIPNQLNGSYRYRVKRERYIFRDTFPEPDIIYILRYSNSATTVVSLGPPNVPSDLTVPATDITGSFSVSWSMVSGAATYELQRQANGGGWITIQDAAAADYSEIGLSSGTYSYRVQACNIQGCSGYSPAESIVVTLPPAEPSPLTGPASDADGSFTVSWASIADATSYELQRNVNGGVWSTIQNTSATSRAESGLTDGTYSYQVRACNTGGCSGYTAAISVVVTIPTPPATPGPIIGPAVDHDGAYSLSWHASADATSYELDRIVNNGGLWSTIQNSSSTNRSESGLSEGTYDYRVRACNNAGCSAYSASHKVTVAAILASVQEITYIHTNHLGSPILTTGAAAQVVWSGERTSYGESTNSTGQSTHRPIGFTGGSDDETTGLVYLINRYYDPSIGRFLSVDPVRFKESNPALFNRYAYANNNPVMYVDPNGLESTGEFFDRQAMNSAQAGSHFATYGWAFAGTAWTWLGAEGVSQVFDKGLEGSTTGDKVGASLETLGIIPLAKLAQVLRVRPSVWTKAPIERGIDIENAVARTDYAGWFRVGQLNNGKFPLVDFQRGNNLVSLKSVDTAGASWMGRMKDHIRALSTNGATVNGSPANMILDIRVQPGGSNAASGLIEFGRQNGVTVIVKEFP